MIAPSHDGEIPRDARNDTGEARGVERPTTRYDLVVLGDLVADLIVPIERLPLLPGVQLRWAEGIFVEPGGAGNVLVAARRLNLATAALGHVGADNYGREMLDMLAAQGVSLAETAISPDRATVLCMVLTDTIGQHAYLGIKDGLGLWSFPEHWRAVIAEAKALYTDGYTLYDILAPDDVFAAFAAARAAATPVFFDPGPSVDVIPRDPIMRALAASDVLLLTESEAASLVGAQERAPMTRALLALGPTTVVLKLGAEGCLVANANEILQVPAFPVDVIDTVGAGDSFAPAFIAGWIRGGDLHACATLANAMGALAATQRGAGTRLPPRERLLEMLANHPEALALTG
jgi:sugar/nucleoside kinase (ribokinase family)